jgi:hypothetical protein
VKTLAITIVCLLSVVSVQAQVDTIFPSIAAHDGWILEESELVGFGALLENASRGGFGLRIGDASGDRQYRSIISFNTSMGTMADCAMVESAFLVITRGANKGTNPFRTHGNIIVDVHRGEIFDSEFIDLEDFDSDMEFPNAAIIREQGGNLAAHTVELDPSMINAHGFTQMRLRFERDDNDDGAADYTGFYAADHLTASRHPRLVVRVSCACE